ncbi:hypothetical protein FOXYSP1_08352 [Fusarium oxysporum f. sp. phaseoli]
MQRPALLSHRPAWPTLLAWKKTVSPSSSHNFPWQNMRQKIR